MVKAQFVKQLEEALIGEVPSAVVLDNTKYYENYIQNEIQKGRTESDVMEELGNPRLIARTIIELFKSENNDYFQSNGEYTENKDTKNRYHYNTNSYNGQDSRFKVFNFNTWFGKVLSWIIIVLFIVFAVWVLTGIASLLIVYAVPILMILILFYFIRSVFRR